MSVDLKNFELEIKKSDSDFTVYVGKINQKKAVLVVPHKIVLEDTFKDLIQQESEIIQQNDIYTTYSIKSPQEFNLRLIYPATDSHITKYLSGLKFTKQSYNEYLQNTNFKEIPWINNIIDGSSSEQIYYQDSDFVLIPNYKWNRSNSDDLQLLLIFKDKNLKTIRDLKSPSILIKAREVIRKEILAFGLDYSDLLVFFHYPPTYNQLHLHIENINMRTTGASSVGRAKLLEDVIYSLSIDLNFYKRDLYFAGKHV
ncbi:m7GpppX diphosphatase [Nosema granulosis]|uniref:M7GpppX diphosphatase n=1 Tax=Nosema granulosis TaxID=83296 RepID=A0A9P6KZU7_9MICR|nr:m7GpppX diphosphatase [Nosema granulosis]